MNARSIGRSSARFLSPFTVCFGLVGLGGCSAPVGEEGSGGTSGETVTTVEQALTPPDQQCGGTTYTTFQVSGSSQIGPAVSSHLCWPTRIDAGGTDQPFLSVLPFNGNWRIAGRGEATCVPQCKFFSQDAGSERALSARFDAVALVPSGGSVATAQTNMWETDAIPIMNTIYHTPGAAVSTDTAEVKFNGNLFALKTVAHNSGRIYQASGYSFFVGVAHVNDSLWQQGPFLVAAGTSFGVMADSLGPCFVTKVSGPPASGSYLFWLERTGGGWFPHAGPNASINVMCYFFNQTGL